MKIIPEVDFKWRPEDVLPMDDVRTSIIAQLMAFPPASKEAHELTDGERVALCIAAGCKMEYRHESTPEGGYRMVATTVNPVGIVKIDGKFRVYERRE